MTTTLPADGFVDRLAIADRYLLATVRDSFTVKLQVSGGRKTRADAGDAHWAELSHAAVKAGMFPIKITLTASKAKFGSAKFALIATINVDGSIVCAPHGFEEAYVLRNGHFPRPVESVYHSLDSALTWLSDSAGLMVAIAAQPIELG